MNPPALQEQHNGRGARKSCAWPNFEFRWLLQRDLKCILERYIHRRRWYEVVVSALLPAGANKQTSKQLAACHALLSAQRPHPLRTRWHGARHAAHLESCITRAHTHCALAHIACCMPTHIPRAAHTQHIYAGTRCCSRHTEFPQQIAPLTSACVSRLWSSRARQQHQHNIARGEGGWGVAAAGGGPLRQLLRNVHYSLGLSLDTDYTPPQFSPDDRARCGSSLLDT